jgi:crossover junction endodeoxyribonuclease RusA
LYGGGSGQRRFPSKSYKAWLAKTPALKHRVSGEIELEYGFWFPDRRNRDAENYVKAVSDYLVNQGVIEDDNWMIVRRMTLIPMGIDKKYPRVDIIIKTAGLLDKQ